MSHENENHIVLPDGDGLRKLLHQIVDRLPESELKAAVIALEELEVSARMRDENAGS